MLTKNDLVRKKLCKTLSKHSKMHFFNVIPVYDTYKIDNL